MSQVYFVFYLYLYFALANALSSAGFPVCVGHCYARFTCVHRGASARAALNAWIVLRGPVLLLLVAVARGGGAARRAPMAVVATSGHEIFFT